MNWLVTAGLLADLVGVFMLFVWPPPAAPMSAKGRYFMVSSEKATPEEQVKENIKLYKSHRNKARVGIAIVFFGFALQLAGQFYP